MKCADARRSSMRWAARSITSEMRTKYARAEDVPEHTIVVITTDGMENASRIYSAGHVKRMIERQKKKYGWEFLFLGANIDAAHEARRIGIAEEDTVDFCADGEGIRLNCEVVGERLRMERAGSAPRDGSRKRRIEEDHAK